MVPNKGMPSRSRIARSFGSLACPVSPCARTSRARCAWASRRPVRAGPFCKRWCSSGPAVSPPRPFRMFCSQRSRT
eukprot:11217631-Lingulodinium_polyedra.AAC.1